MLKHLSL